MAVEHSPGRVVWDADWHELKLEQNGYVIARLPRPHPKFRGKERAEESATIRANGERLASLWNAACEVQASPALAGPPVPRYSGWLWTHVVKGGDYRMLGEAKLQTDKPLSDMAEVVVYQGADGKLWAREKQEFEARFSRTRPDPHGVRGRVTLTPEGEAVVPGIGVEFAMQCLARADALLQGIADQDVTVNSAAHELHHALEVLRRAHGVPPSDELRAAAQEAADYLAELYAKYQARIGPFATQAQRINGRLRAALGVMVDAVTQERERCAAIADDEARIREEAGRKHPEESAARDRCFAAARAAANVAKGIRSGEVVAGVKGLDDAS